MGFKTYQKLDLFGVPPSLTLQGQNKINSNFGFLMTLLVVVLGGSMAIFFSDDMIHRKNPIANRSDIRGGSTEKQLTLTPDLFNMKFGISIEQSSTYYIDETIYTVQAKMYVDNYYLDPEAECSNFLYLKLNACPSDWGDGFLYCLDPKIPDDLRQCLKDKTQEDLFLMVGGHLIYIDFFKCVGNTCQDADLIDEKLNAALWVAEYEEFTVDTQDFENPIKTYITIDRFNILADMQKFLYYDLGMLEFTTDYGLILSSTTTEKLLYKETVKSDIATQSNNKFFSFCMQTGGNKIEYSRKYDKVQDVLANFSGMLGICIIIIRIVVPPFATAKLYESVINNVYRVNLNTKRKKDKDIVKSSKLLKLPTKKIPTKDIKKIELMKSNCLFIKSD